MILNLNGVRKDYGRFCLNCSLQVEEGCVTGLIGQNGAGKSTTFKAILDLISLDRGELQIFGKAHRTLTPSEKESIGVVLSDTGFSEFLTVEQVGKVLERLYQRFDRSRFASDCRRFDLPEKKKLKELSTGMKAKLKLLAALSHRPKLLLLDEPTAGLDVVARNELLDMLRAYMEIPGNSILISSHISGDLEGLCDDLYLLHEGKILLHEETDVLLDSYGILKVREADYPSLDPSYIKAVQKEAYGYACLTDQKQFYLENYPSLLAERGGIDDLVMMMVKGERR